MLRILPFCLICFLLLQSFGSADDSVMDFTAQASAAQSTPDPKPRPSVGKPDQLPSPAVDQKPEQKPSIGPVAKMARPGDSARGVVAQEHNKELVLDIQPCTDQRMRFQEPYKKTPTGTQQKCGGTTFTVYEVVKQ